MQAVVITACTNRKSFMPAPSLRARELASGAVEDVAQAWLGRLEAAEPRVFAGRLYRGRAFADAKAAAKIARARLLIASAGIGLIEADTPVPSYSLTVIPGSLDCILLRLRPRSSPPTWWAQIAARSPFSTRLSAVMSSSPGLVLLALPSAYLRMVQVELLELSRDARGRFRIFGLGLRDRVAPGLQPLVMPYDGCLDDPRSSYRGTRSDFASRALRHFAEVVLEKHPEGSAEQHRTAIEAALAGWQQPSTPRRPRLSDERILGLIRTHWNDADGHSSRMLRLLRDHLAVACEQARFRALFHTVRLERAVQP